MKKNTKQITTVGIFSAISFILMMIEVNLLFMPPFLKLDLSTVPSLITGFMFGPVSGVLTVLVKDLLHLLMTRTGGVGELADFICSCAIVLISSLIYRKNKSKKNAVVGLVFGVAGLIISAILVNMYILIPFYANVMPIEQIFEACGKINPYIHDTLSYVLWGALPFNLVKGLILSTLTMLLYKKVSKIIK